jgi:iron complex outermembrane receptor protein
VSAESLLDAQIGYAVQQGPLKGLSFSLSGTNLTDEPFQLRSIGAEEYNFVKYENYGAVYSIGVNYTFE